MATSNVVGTMSEWSGVIRDLFRQIDDGSLTLGHLQALNEHRNPFAITDIRQEWQEFYRKYFRLMVDFSAVVIPDDPGGYDRVIFIPQGLTLNSVVKVLRKQFKASLYDKNLDKDVTQNVRTSEKAYATRCRERQEADEELKSTSANQLQEQGINCLTLLERLVYELKYWSETGQHLDLSNLTLCAGSRFSGGSVPSVHWYSDDDYLQVFWYFPGDAYAHLRARQAVS